MTRKTMDVAELTKQFNRGMDTPDSSLRVSELTPEQAFRLGRASVLEQVLHATGNYKGWNIPASQRDAEGLVLPDADDTRRFYYL